MAMRTILVTGAMGQIGSQLVAELRRCFGSDQVIASDIRMAHGTNETDDTGAMPHEHLDCVQGAQLNHVIERWNVGTIYHLGALLSAVAEDKPQLAWRVNMDGLYNVLEAARQHQCALFFPSSIGAFGPSTPRLHTPQVTIQRPTAMYGITKVAGELLCDYYAQRFKVDTRGLRLPGLISADAMPGGGTTDYAVHIFHDAVRHGRYTCFLKPDTRLDMMYMSDAVRAMIEVMLADPRTLKHRNAYNLAAMNFTPAELAQAITAQMPEFVIDYEVDPIRQAIADSWPKSVDDSAARQDWGWQPAFDLPDMVRDMFQRLHERRPEKTNAV